MRVRGCPWRRSSLLARKDEDEQHREREVDEVHRLDEANGQEEQGLQPALRLGLTGHALDQRATGQAVTDRGADRATAERDTTADETTHQFEALSWCVSHFSSIP